MQFKASLITLAAFFAVSNAATINLEARQRQSGVLTICTEPNFGGYCENVTADAGFCKNLSDELVSGGVESVSLSAPSYFYCHLVSETSCPVDAQVGLVIPSVPYSTLSGGVANNIVSVRCTCTDEGPCGL